MPRIRSPSNSAVSGSALSSTGMTLIEGLACRVVDDLAQEGRQQVDRQHRPPLVEALLGDIVGPVLALAGEHQILEASLAIVVVRLADAIELLHRLFVQVAVGHHPIHEVAPPRPRGSRNEVEATGSAKVSATASHSSGERSFLTSRMCSLLSISRQLFAL